MAGILAVALALGACGGGGDAPTTAGSTPSRTLGGSKYTIEKVGSPVEDGYVDCTETGHGFADCKVRTYGARSLRCRHVKVSEIDDLATREGCPAH
jgi:hypothetical protein